MNMGLLDSNRAIPIEHIVDFDDQLASFKRITTRKDRKRLMFISAPSGRGKSTLIRKMLDLCQDQQIPCCLIDYKDGSYDAPHFYLAREICEQLGLTPENLNHAMIPLSVSSGGGTATTEVRGNVTDSTIVTQVSTNIHLNGESLQKTHVKQRLKRAFLDDLNSMNRMAICFIDSLEEISREDENWLLEALLCPVQDGELKNLIVVTVGERWPKVQDWAWEDEAIFIYDLPPMEVEHFIEYAKRLGYNLPRKKACEYWKKSKGLPILMGCLLKDMRFTEK